MLGRRDYASLLETLDGRSPHPGHKLGVIPIGAVADRSPEARVDDGGEVRVDTGPQELATHSGGDVVCFVRVCPATDLGSSRLRRDPGGRGDVAPLLVDGDEERHRGVRLHGELLKRAGQGLYLLLALHVVAEEDNTANVPLSHHLLDVIVGLSAAYADDEHLPHHVPDAHPRHSGYLCVLVILGGILVLTSCRMAFSGSAAASQDEEK